MSTFVRRINPLIRSSRPYNLVARCQHSSTAPIVLVDQQSSGVRTVTLNNPKQRNALSLDMILSLQESLKDEKSLRAILIRANGEKVFSSGHDLKEMAAGDKDFHRRLFEECTKMVLAIRQSPVPVICQVDGLAAAAGCQLVASCDIVLATERSSFSTPGASVGLFCSTPGVAVSRAANAKTAAYMLLTGLTISAQEALTAGLITRIIPDSKLQAETENVINSILSKSRSVIAFGKQFFYKQIELDLATAYSQGGCAMVDNLQFKDCQEGIDSFVSKRKPTWTHQ